VLTLARSQVSLLLLPQCFGRKDRDGSGIMRRVSSKKTQRPTYSITNSSWLNNQSINELDGRPVISELLDKGIASELPSHAFRRRNVFLSNVFLKGDIFFERGPLEQGRDRPMRCMPLIPTPFFTIPSYNNTSLTSVYSSRPQSTILHL
jgi:hypothetical protein